MTTSTQTDSTKHLTLVYRITSPAQQTKLLAEGQWVASAHSDVLAERDALQKRVRELESFERAWTEWNAKTEWVQETCAAGELGKHRADVLRERISRLEVELEAAKDVAEWNALTGAGWAGRVQELEAQLDAVGAGGVEPLRKRECLHQIQEPPATSLPSYLGGASEKLSQAARQVVKTLQAAAQPASQPSPAPQLASLAADAREIFCDYPTKAQRAVDEVIEWFSASINVEIYKAEAAQPIAPRSTTEESLAVKALATTGIDSPFNACMYQEQCKRWRDAAVRQPLTEDQIAEIYAYNKINPMRFARAIEEAVWKQNS